MESVIIETLGCPLDFNLSQSWEQGSSHTHTSSDYSESADEETEIKHEDNLTAQIKSLSFANASDSKLFTLKSSNETFNINAQENDISGYSESDKEETEIDLTDDFIEQMKNLSFANATDSIYSNKTSKINSQVKENPRRSISMEKKEIEEILSSSFTLKYKEALKFVKEIDVESTFCECKTKNCETYSEKKDNTEKPSFVENLDNVENQFSSLSLKNNKILNECYKSGFDNSDEDESDSDDDEQAESVILKERGHTKHNRPQNNRQQRPTPFTQDSSTSSRHFNLHCLQTFENFSPVSYGFNASSDGYDSISHINSDNLGTHVCGIVSPSNNSFYTDFSTSESKTCQVLRNIFSGTATEEVLDSGVPYEVPERVVPSAEYNGNVNDKFLEETNDASSFYHCQRRRLSGYAAINAEKETLDSYLENLNVEEVGHLISNLDTLPLISNEDLENVFNNSSILNQNICVESSLMKFSNSNSNQHNFQSKLNHGHSSFSKANIKDSTLGVISGQNPVDLLPRLSSEDLENVFNNSSTSNKTNCVESTVEKICFPNNNQHNFYSEPDHRHSYFSKANVGDSTSDDICDQNLVDLYPSPPLSCEYQENFSSDFSTSNQKICVESTVEKISYPSNNQHNFHTETDHRHPYFSKACAEEFGYYSNSVCENISSINCESSSPETTDYERFSKEMENEIKRIQKKDYKSNGTKRINNNQTCKTSNKSGERKIITGYGTAARDTLFNSPTFCKRKWKLENEEIRNLIKNGELGTEEKMVIHILKKNRKTKYRGTNLHYAIRDENIEKVFCLVECHKECHGGLGEINIRDNSDKTVLDYSKEKGFDLLTAYLEENTAKSYSEICI